MELHIFDVDHTLLSCNGSYEFGRYLYGKGVISLSDSLYCTFRYAHHKILGSSFLTLHNTILKRIFFQRNKKHLSSLVESFFDERLKSLFNPKALKLLEEAQKRGDEIALASNSPDFLIQALAKRLYIKHYTATRYLLNLQNYFIKIEDIIDGKSKAEYTFDLCKRLGIAIENTTAYSDSLYDLPLLEITGKAIGVNPDKSLLKICQERGWDIVK